MRSVSYIACCALLSAAASAPAQTQIVYINGIQNTKKDASESAKAIAEKLNNSTNRSGVDKRLFTAEYIWNPIGFSGSTATVCDVCQDKKELFVEKTAEEHFIADFQKILAPHNASSVMDIDAAVRVKAYFDDMTPGSNSLESSGAVTDADMDPTRKAITGILNKFRVAGAKIFVAHSQGNMLVNLAWAAYVSEVGQDAQKTAKIVNVANTSSFSINGLSLTHGNDAALFSSATRKPPGDVSLETLPSQYSDWSRTTPECANAACPFRLAPSPFGGVNDTGGFLDHAFVDTYLSTIELPIVSVDQGVNFLAGRTRFIDRFEDLVYAAAASLQSNSTSGQDITFVASGTIFQIYDPSGVLPGELGSPYQIGTIFTTEYTFDPMTPDRGAPANPSFAAYDVKSGSVKIGSNAPSIFVNAPGVFNTRIFVDSFISGSSYDIYQVGLSNQSVVFGPETRKFVMVLSSLAGDGIFPTDALPTTPPDLSRFPMFGNGAKYQLLYVCPSGSPPCGQIFGTVDSLVRR